MLTAKQEQFARHVALDGMNYSDAYRSAYNTQRMTDKSIWDAASKLKDNPGVTQRIEELKAQVAEAQIMSAQKRAEKLSRMAERSPDPNVVIKSIDLLNKMTGEYVQKIDSTVNVVKLEDLL